MHVTRVMLDSQMLDKLLGVFILQIWHYYESATRRPPRPASHAVVRVRHLWHVATHEELFTLRRLDSSGHLHFDFSRNGRRLAAVAGDRQSHGHRCLWSTSPDCGH